MRIDPVIGSLHEGASRALNPKGPGSAGSASFVEQLQSKVCAVNDLQNQADEAMAESTVKGAANIHETMIRLEEADIGLRFLARFRTKALDAYQEIMRMQF